MADDSGSGNGKVAQGREAQKLDDLHAWHQPGGGCWIWRTDMENRMRGVEGFRWQIIGVLGTINAVGVVTILLALRAWAER